MQTFSDEEGRTWKAERIGRTSGIVSSQPGSQSLPGPADIIRFVCESDPDEQDRETTMKAGMLSSSTEADLVSVFVGARKIRRR
jgi:hypothetical protein